MVAASANVPEAPDLGITHAVAAAQVSRTNIHMTGIARL